MFAFHHASAPRTSSGRTLASWAARYFLARAVTSGLAAAASGQAPRTAAAHRTGSRMRRHDIDKLLRNGGVAPRRVPGGGRGTWIVPRGRRFRNGGAAILAALR